MPESTFSGVHVGTLQAGERVTLTDTKGRRRSIVLKEDGEFFTNWGVVAHNDLIGRDEGNVVRSVGGMEYLAFRLIARENVVSMKRGATIIYPKDAAEILVWGDIFPGARVLEAGAGSGGLTTYLLRGVGESGKVYSYERREDFAQIAQHNIETFFGGSHPAWTLTVGDLNNVILDVPIDRAVLDMLAPWECIESVAEVLVAGGILCCYVATTTQLGRVMDTLRVHGGFTEPEAREVVVREWHAEGLAIRPGHGTSGHTGFLVFSRRLASGVTAPQRRRRPAPGAYGPDYHGPRPPGVDAESAV